MSRLILFIAVTLWSALGTVAQELRALAHIDPERSSVEITDVPARVTLALSQAVPFRVFTLERPARLVLDFREVAFDGLDARRLMRSGSEALRFGPFAPGWSRLVLTLPGPLAVETAEMRTDSETGEAMVIVMLQSVPPELFSELSGVPRGAGWTYPEPAAVAAPKMRRSGDRPLVVVLDPGHGGIDPGAQSGGVDEADLVLTFARELRDVLVLSGAMEVHLTRDADVFVPLQTRISLARRKGADVFLSLHADALAAGRATGTTIYTLSETASDEASEILAERHDRNDLLSGIDLSRQDDAVASVLMDMARVDTMARTDKLAEALVTAIKSEVGQMHKRPWLEAGFSVLRAPDIPSALIELGFLSDVRDRARLTDPEWRARLTRGILLALQRWALEDAADARLILR